MKKTYVLDTNVFLTNAKSIFEFQNNDIIIPLKVLDEIDKHKKRQDGVGLNARSIIRILDNLTKQGKSCIKELRIAKGKGILSVRGYDIEDLPNACDLQSADNEIITTAITEQKKNLKRKVIVVTRDINMRVKCDSLGMLTEDYITNKVVTDRNKLFTGFAKHLVDDQTIDHVYEGQRSNF
jgi:PhoH-like ATPase